MFVQQSNARVAGVFAMRTWAVRRRYDRAVKCWNYEKAKRLVDRNGYTEDKAMRL